jgi:hypothetical protein
MRLGGMRIGLLHVGLGHVLHVIRCQRGSGSGSGEQEYGKAKGCEFHV